MCAADYWGIIVNGLAALGSIGAAFAALFIATRDRRERNRERNAADEAQANLLIIEATDSNGPGFSVAVTNYGTRAVLNVEFDSATYDLVPDATPDLRSFDELLPVLDADRKPYRFWVGFLDEAGESIITGRTDELGNWHSDNAELSQVNLTIRWLDADGNRWKRSNRGSAERL
jgi:hypothetical protein